MFCIVIIAAACEIPSATQTDTECGLIRRHEFVSHALRIWQ